jgi:hypothetical protein
MHVARAIASDTVVIRLVIYLQEVIKLNLKPISRRGFCRFRSFPIRPDVHGAKTIVEQKTGTAAKEESDRDTDRRGERGPRSPSVRPVCRPERRLSEHHIANRDHDSHRKRAPPPKILFFTRTPLTGTNHRPIRSTCTKPPIDGHVGSIAAVCFKVSGPALAKLTIPTGIPAAEGSKIASFPWVLRFSVPKHYGSEQLRRRLAAAGIARNAVGTAVRRRLQLRRNRSRRLLPYGRRRRSVRRRLHAAVGVPRPSAQQE